MKQEKGQVDRNLINPEVLNYIEVLKKGGADITTFCHKLCQ